MVSKNENNKMERKLIINNFRNVGITLDGKEKPAELVLNRSLEEENIGDLVFLVGPNNSGKSNVLAALESLGGEIKKSDSPEFGYLSLEPAVSMNLQYMGKKIEVGMINDVEKQKKNHSFPSESVIVDGYFEDEYFEDESAIVDIIIQAAIDLEEIKDPSLESLKAYLELLEDVGGGEHSCY